MGGDTKITVKSLLNEVNLVNVLENVVINLWFLFKGIYNHV